MCGIAGYWLRDGLASEAGVRAMCDLIRHRGPDDEGFHVDGGCGIGMRRLSIIDLATGHQPISNEDGTVWIVFNGEIYDYQNLRRSLIARGHRFATQSDTETIIHLYEEDGPDGIRELRGMFAFAIWDSRRRRLLIARDRFGEKPLYWGVFDKTLLFASEPKVLLAHPAVRPSLNLNALRQYLSFAYITAPVLIY